MHHRHSSCDEDVSTEKVRSSKNVVTFMNALAKPKSLQPRKLPHWAKLGPFSGKFGWKLHVPFFMPMAILMQWNTYKSRNIAQKIRPGIRKLFLPYEKYAMCPRVNFDPAICTFHIHPKKSFSSNPSVVSRFWTQPPLILTPQLCTSR